MKLLGRLKESVLTPRFIVTSSLVAVLLLSTALTSVFVVRVMYGMRGYEWSTTAIIYPLAICVLQFPVVWARRIFWNAPPPEERDFPQWQYAVTAFIASAGNVLTGLPQNIIPGPYQVVFGQLQLPLTMAASLVFFKLRFRWTHYLGAVIVLGAIAISAVPDFVAGSGDAVPLGWLFIYLSSNVPVTAHFMLKEKWMKVSNVDVFHFRTWNALYELMSGCLLVWMTLLPLPGGRPGVPIKQFPQWFLDSFLCLGGDLNLGIVPGQCRDVWIYYLLFIAANICMNLSMLAIVKRLSAATLSVVQAAAIPLTAVLFLSSFLAGPGARSSIGPYNIAAIVLVVAGTVLYEWRAEEGGLALQDKKNPNEENGDGSSETRPLLADQDEFAKINS